MEAALRQRTSAEYKSDPFLHKCKDYMASCLSGHHIAGGEPDHHPLSIRERGISQELSHAGPTANALRESGHPRSGSGVYLLIALVDSLQAKFDVSSDMDALNHAIDALHNQTEAAGDMRCMARLAHSLSHRYRQMGNTSDIDRSVNLWRNILATPEIEQDILPFFGVEELAKALCNRFTKAGNLADLEESILLCNHTLQSMSPDHPSRAILLSTLGRAHRIRFDRFNDQKDVTEAVKLQSQALALCNPSSPELCWVLLNHGDALRVRFHEYGDRDNLEDAIDQFRRAIGLYPPRAPYRHMFLGSLALTLCTRYQFFGAEESLDEAIELQRAALAGMHPMNSSRFIAVVNLGMSLATRQSIHGTVNSDMDESIALYEEGLSLLRDNPKKSLPTRNNLAEALSGRYSLTGNLDDLQQAIQCYREALGLCDDNNFIRPVLSSGLSQSLCSRYIHLADQSDLDEAVALARLSLSLCPLSHVRRPIYTGSLAEVLLLRYNERSNDSDLHESVTLLRETLTLLPNEAPDRWVEMGSLAHALGLRSKLVGFASELHEAIQLFDVAVSISRPGHIRRPELLGNASAAYRNKIKRDGDSGNLAVKSRSLASEAIRILPSGDPQRAEFILELAELELEVANDSTVALDLIRQGMSDDTSSAYVRFTKVLNLLPRLSQLHSADRIWSMSVLESYKELVALLPRLAYFGQDIKTRLRTLRSSKVHDLISAISLITFPLSEFSAALELLEQCCGFFWGHALRLRAPVEDLPRSVRKELATLLWQLEMASFRKTDEESSMDKTQMERDAGLTLQRSNRLNDLIKEIRTDPQHQRFMLPEDIHTLLQSAEKGPVIMLVAEENDCRALIIPSTSGSVLGLSLTGTHSKWLVEASGSWRQYASESRGEVASRLVMGKKKVYPRVPPKHDQYRILFELWNNIMKPIINALGFKPSLGRNRPHIWLCSTGPFSFLPLHGAGNYSLTGESLCDYAVVSYTPTLATLLNARKGSYKIPGREAKVLLAAVPTPSASAKLFDIPYTIHELREIQTAIPEDLVLRVSPDDDPLSGGSGGMSVRALLDKLPEANVLHLACHGTQDYNDPLESGFVMRDGMVTISTLMPIPLPKAFLAFLSACETAKGAENQPDQAVHLAATMLFAGFKSVVATLWSMDDVDGPVIQRALCPGCSRSAVAARTPVAEPLGTVYTPGHLNSSESRTISTFRRYKV